MEELVADRLWTREMPLTLFGLKVSTRMSVVRLSGEGRGLWLHSPVALDRRLRETLDALGRVRFVVCPNRGHHMFAGEYFAAYPDASVYAAPGLSEKRPDLPFHGVLGDEPEPGWGQDLEQTIFRGRMRHLARLAAGSPRGFTVPTLAPLRTFPGVALHTKVPLRHV